MIVEDVIFNYGYMQVRETAYFHWINEPKYIEYKNPYWTRVYDRENQFWKFRL